MTTEPENRVRNVPPVTFSKIKRNPDEGVAYKAYDEMIYPDTVPEEITPEDYESLDPDIAKDCTKGLFNALWVLPKLPQEVQEKVMRILGLRLSSDLVLLKHEIQTGKGTSKTKSITYYSLWIHLSSAKVKESATKSGDVQYGNSTTPICLPPNTVIGKYGTAETEDNTYQLEYFTKPSFKVEIEKNNSQKYLIIPKDSPLYTVTTSAQKVVRQLAKNSILEITENADPDKHPNSMRVKIKKYSATIDIEGAKNKLKGETLTEEQKSKVDSLTINDFIAGNAYKLPEGFGNVLTALPMKTKYGKEEKAFTALPVEVEVIGHIKETYYEGTIKVNGINRDIARTVYQRYDIDWDLVIADKCMTNLEWALKGNSPRGIDGEPINLHHFTQEEPGVYIEMLYSKHSVYTKKLHGLIPDGGDSYRIDKTLDNQFKIIRKQYWKDRAIEVCKERGIPYE